MKKLRTITLLAVFLILMIVPVHAAALKLNSKKITLTVGKQRQLKVKNPTAKVKWKSSDKSIASVKKGLVTAKKAGSCKITATISGNKLVCKVTVKADKKSGSNGSSKSDTVWISATGTKYHSINNCGRMNPSKATSMTVSQAKAAGYTPCSNCIKSGPPA